MQHSTDPGMQMLVNRDQPPPTLAFLI